MTPILTNGNCLEIILVAVEVMSEALYDRRSALSYLCTGS